TAATTTSPKEQLRTSLGSHKRNLMLADDRAKAVDRILEGAQRANAAEEKVAFWLQSGERGEYRDDQQDLVSRRYQQMSLRLYPDRGTTGDASALATYADYDRGAGAMNRRVDLEFQSMGVCTIDGLQRALQNVATSVTNSTEGSPPKNWQEQ